VLIREWPASIFVKNAIKCLQRLGEFVRLGPT
jgi:hypothetical protein